MASARYALVTGGNRGIGLEVCKQLVARGKPVLLTCRNSAQGKDAADRLVAATPTAVVKCLDLDTSDSSSIERLAALVASDYDQQIDLLVNNAGILIGKTWDQQAYDSTVAVNTKGPIELSQALLPHLATDALIVMVSSGLGRLENLTADYQDAIQAAVSLEALQAIPFNPDSPMGTAAPAQGAFAPTYSVAKALLNKAVQLLVQDGAFKARGIRVVSTCPGWCRTDMGTAAADRSAEQGGSSVLWPAWNWSSSLQASFTRDGEAMPW